MLPFCWQNPPGFLTKSGFSNAEAWEVLVPGWASQPGADLSGFHGILRDFQRLFQGKILHQWFKRTGWYMVIVWLLYGEWWFILGIQIGGFSLGELDDFPDVGRSVAKSRGCFLWDDNRWTMMGDSTKHFVLEVLYNMYVSDLGTLFVFGVPKTSFGYVFLGVCNQQYQAVWLWKWWVHRSVGALIMGMIHLLESAEKKVGEFLMLELVESLEWELSL